MNKHNRSMAGSWDMLAKAKFSSPINWNAWEVILWFDNDKCETTTYRTRGEAYEYAHDNMGRCRSVEIYGPNHYNACQC